MKKLLMIGCLALINFAVTAQTKVMKITPIKKGEEPQRVMDSIKSDFPAAISRELSFLPAALYGKEWNVNVQGGDDSTEPNRYQINLKQGKSEYVAVYDNVGNLLSSKQIVHDADLPASVHATVKQFKGWHVDKKHEVIKYRKHKTTDVYRIKLQKGAEHKTVFIDPTGQIINTRFDLM